jgi:hypothetical protein
MKSPQRRIAAAGIVTLGIVILAAFLAIGLQEKDAASRDFIGYWAAGQQLVRGANPYDIDQVLSLEKSVGLGDLQLKVAPNPPIGLAIVLPLGFLSAKNGLIFWILLQLGCLSVALWILWRLAGMPSSRLHLFGYLFPPAVACLMAGQLGIFFLLALSLFLLWRETRPWLAGAALLPLTLKPHLFLPAALALLLWVVLRRKPQIFAGLIAASALGYAIVLAFDPHAGSQFIANLHSSIMQGRFSPTLSAYLRLDIAPRAAWLEYLPTALAGLWATWFFWSRRAYWDWTHHGQRVLLVSVMCAPYAWVTDEAVLLPAVLFAAYRAIETRRSLIPIAIFTTIALVELFANVRISAWYYTWTTPAWLAWHLYATRPQNSMTTG